MTRPSRRTTALCVALSLAAGTALADEWESVPPVRHEPTRSECGECHMAFQPALLPATAWRRIMAGLDDHFGDNASLPADTARDIERYLVANAGRGDAGELRITGQRWWRREHDEIRAGAWKSPQVVTRSNCPACHRDAERGWYEDD